MFGIFRSSKEVESTTLSESLDRYLKEVSANKKWAYQETRRIESHILGKRFLATAQEKGIVLNSGMNQSALSNHSQKRNRHSFPFSTIVVKK